MAEATHGKIALVTGANKGIGLETARQLGKLGFTVLMGARDAANGQAAAAKLKAEGIDARFLKLDVANQADRQAAAAHINQNFNRLDVLINNAAIMNDMALKPNDVPLDTLRQTFDTNFFSVVALTQTLLPLIKKSPAGRIVNLSSILGSLTLHSDPNSPIANSKPFAYDASKTALNAYTVHLAWELKNTPIKVNAAHPGWVKTDMGTAAAPMEIVDGAKTSVALATLPPDGPTGAFIHLGKPLPW